MDVHGKKLQSIESAIDEKCCKPCYQDGESVQAEAYCTSCKKGLCSTCVIAHRKQMKSHRICDQIYDEESYEPCERHPKEFIKYYCPKHDSLICGHCSVLEHGSCKVEILSELCKIENNMELLTEKDIFEELLASKTGLGSMKEKHEAPRKKQLFARCITKELVLLVAFVIIGIIVPVVVNNKGDNTPIDLTSLRYTRTPDIPFNVTYGSEMLFLPGDRLLISNQGRNKSIMVDLHTNNLMFEVSLPGSPWSMCILPGERLAVSLKEIGRIQFLNTRGQLSLEGNIKVDDNCCGIGYHNDRLIVSYWSGKVEIMDMTGNVIKTIDKYNNGQSIFILPLYLNVVSNVQTAAIYVSDYGQYTITKLDMDLNILQIFWDLALIQPHGISTVGNQLLICSSNNILCLDLSSGKITQLLGEVEGLDCPMTVCYNHKQNKLYLTLSKQSSINVYQGDLTLN